MKKQILFGGLGFLLVAFGQPGWSPALAPFAAAFGYALFWRAFLLFPTKKKRFWVATSFFAFAQLVQFSWMTSYEYQGLYILGVYLFLAFCFGVQFGFLSLLIPERGKMSVLNVLMLASVWTLFEWVRYFALCGVTFNPTGLALTGSLFSLQLAAIWGILGLSFWVMLTNGFAFNFLKDRFKASSCALWLGVALVPYIFGAGYLAFHQRSSANSQTLEVALVQTGLLPSQKVPLKGRFDAFISPLKQWERVVSSLQTGIHSDQSIDLIAMPESAFPLMFDQTVYPYEPTIEMLEHVLGSRVKEVLPNLEAPYAKSFIKDDAVNTYVSNAFFAQTLANYFHSDVVVGLDGRDHTSGINYSSAYFFRPGQAEIGRYEKRVLLPLAEYLPFEWCRDLARRYGITEFFEPGREAKVFQSKLPIGISICYEETFSQMVREGRQKGAQVLVNVTNDNWYPDSRLPKQHFDLARVRTVENGAPLVRSCNSGITAAIDSHGRIIAKHGLAKDRSEWSSGLLVASVKADHYKPPYYYWGNMGILTICFAVIFFYLASQKMRKWRKF